MVINLGNATEAILYLLFISGEVFGESFGDIFSKDFGNSSWINMTR